MEVESEGTHRIIHDHATDLQKPSSSVITGIRYLYLTSEVFSQSAGKGLISRRKLFERQTAKVRGASV